MSNEVVGYQDSKELVAIALDPIRWYDSEITKGDYGSALKLIDSWLIPLKEEGLEGNSARKLVGKLRIIGAKISPTMSEEQVQVWLSAMVAALSNLPVRITCKACDEAIHVPMRYLNEVEGVIRECAQSVSIAYKMAQRRLKDRAIENGKN